MRMLGTKESTAPTPPRTPSVTMSRNAPSGISAPSQALSEAMPLSIHSCG